MSQLVHLAKNIPEGRLENADFQPGGLAPRLTGTTKDQTDV